MESLDQNILNKDQVNQLKENTKRARIAGYVFLAIGILSVITAVSSWFEMDLLTRIKDGGDFTEEEANLSDIRQGVLAILTFALNIASIVTFLNWFRRAYGNLERAGVKNLMYEENKVIYSFMIPIISLYRPFQITKEINEKTQKKIQQLSADYEIKSSSALIIVWWTLYLITNVIGQVVFRTALKSETIDQMITGAEVSIVADIITIPAAFATYFLIKDIAKKEALLFDLMQNENLKIIDASS